jgi:hypothetical protein
MVMPTYTQNLYALNNYKLNEVGSEHNAMNRKNKPL